MSGLPEHPVHLIAVHLIRMRLTAAPCSSAVGSRIFKVDGWSDPTLPRSSG